MPHNDLTPAFSEAEGALRDFLRQQPAMNSVVAKRIFLGLPRQGPSSWPAIDMFRVGGGPEDGDYPIDGVHMQFDVWGDKGDKLRCWSVAQALVSTLLSLECGTMISAGVRFLGVYGINVPYMPDPGTGQARYVVDCKVQCQAVA